ncbi:hypothetical protein M405DRAFT_869290 [Rhizopogon salebrosus TDB-379]|nr:hypothetical protein M405DRAFT_869290 [Rhizopogon salebrosus TDB-379]
MKLTAVLSLQTTPPGVSSCSRHPNAPSLVLAAFQSVPIATKHTCLSSQPSATMSQVPTTAQTCNPSAASPSLSPCSRHSNVPSFGIIRADQNIAATKLLMDTNATQRPAKPRDARPSRLPQGFFDDRRDRMQVHCQFRGYG